MTELKNARVLSVLFSLWQVIPRLLYNTTPSIFIPPQPEKFLCSGSLAPPFYVYVACVCGWRSTVSVGEGMACLCAPEGLPTHSWEEKATRPEYHPALLFSGAPFTPFTTIALGLCGKALFVFAHTPTDSQRGMARTKTMEKREGGIFQFLP